MLNFQRTCIFIVINQNNNKLLTIASMLMSKLILRNNRFLYKIRLFRRGISVLLVFWTPTSTKPNVKLKITVSPDVWSFSFFFGGVGGWRFNYINCPRVLSAYWMSAFFGRNQSTRLLQNYVRRSLIPTKRKQWSLLSTFNMDWVCLPQTLWPNEITVTHSAQI